MNVNIQYSMFNNTIAIVVRHLKKNLKYLPTTSPCYKFKRTYVANGSVVETKTIKRETTTNVEKRTKSADAGRSTRVSRIKCAYKR